MSKVCTDVADSVCTNGECGCKPGYVQTSKNVFTDNNSTEPYLNGAACMRKSYTTYATYGIVTTTAYAVLSLL